MTKRAVETRAPHHLLTRLLDTPHLAQVVQSLEPRVLHQLVRHCGLEDCGEILALATTEQLVRVFDDDLWRSDQGGEEDQFDADRFGLWLEVLAEMDIPTAAKKLVEMDLDFVTAALSRHLLVLNQETVILGETASVMGGVESNDPLEIARSVLVENALDDCLHHDVGGYEVVAKRSESWDALLPILVSLEEDHRPFFGKLMKRCCHLSTEHILDNGGLYEVLTSDEQVMADIAEERERRREEEGHVSPSQAVAFLKMSRQRREGGKAETPSSDPMTVAYFREWEHRRKSASGSGGTVATGGEPRAMESEVAAFLTTLQAGGVLEKPRPSLLPAGLAPGESHLLRIRAHLQFAMESDAAVYARRTEELAYLSNVLIAGCSFASRRFRSVEAANAVLATCNLGLENWSRTAQGATSRELPPSFLLGQDLVAVFRKGWSLLYEEVGLFVPERLVEILSDLRCDDDEVQDQIGDLCRVLKAQVKAGTPWRAREELDVLAILDQPSWATLLGLVDECPVVPKVAQTTANGRPPLRVTSEFEFISENRQIGWVRDFLESLPRRLVET